MTIPISIKRKLERVAKENSRHSLAAIQQKNGEDLGIELHSLCRDLSDTSDQIANDVWKSFNVIEQIPSPKKPNVYWPISKDKSTFENLLKKMGMENLEDRSKAIFDAFCSTQPWSSQISYVTKVKNYASMRHERDLEVDIGYKHEGVAIGKGNTYIKELRIEKGQIVKLEGYEFNGGIKKPISVEHQFSVGALDKSTQQEIFRLIDNACAELTSLSASIYRELV
jgi:hypothetical protein